jgi:hypothetical protein
MRRAILALVTLMALSQTATATVPLFGHVSCSLVRFYVARYSEAAAEKWARGHGASETDIETARRCLHGASVQTASSAAKSPAVVPVAEQEPARSEPAERDPDQDTPHVVTVQGQHALPAQDNHDNEPGVDGFIGPKDIEDRVAERVSYENKDRPAPAEGKTATSPPRHVGAVRRADSAGARGHGTWLKQLWDRLAGRHQFRVAFLHFRADRRWR